MATNVPKTSTVLTALIRADLTTLLRNRRSVIVVLLVPNIILVTWKVLIAKIGGPFVLSTAITMGLMAIGLMGYSITVARDRDKGIFQRLRVTPVPTWTIMLSRLITQMLMIITLTLLVFIVGSQYDKVTLPVTGYLVTFLVAFIGGAVYLSLGQLIVGLIKNPETVNAVTRLVYFLFIMTGMVGDLGGLGPDVKKWTPFSPYGSVKTMLAVSMDPSKWSHDATIALLLSIGYAIVFATIGINKFKWEAR